MEKENVFFGSLLTLLAFFLVAVMSALAKYANQFFPTLEVVFFQNVISFLILVPFFIKEKQVWRTKKIGMHLVRALTGSGYWFCLFLAFRYTSLTEATLLTYSACLWIPLVSFIFLKEHFAKSVWVGVSIGFMGIVFVLHPSAFLQNWTWLGSGISLLGSCLLTFALLSVRYLKTTEKTMTILFYYFGLSSIVFFAIAFPGWRMPSAWNEWIPLVIIGVFSALTQLFIVLAYEYASPAKLSAIVYSVIVFTALIDWLVWHTSLNIEVWLGIALVVVGGTISSIPKKALHKS